MQDTGSQMEELREQARAAGTQFTCVSSTSSTEKYSTKVQIPTQQRSCERKRVQQVLNVLAFLVQSNTEQYSIQKYKYRRSRAAGARLAQVREHTALCVRMCTFVPVKLVN
jgi:hypothetical protein